MHVEGRRYLGVDRLKELKELLTPMPPMTLADDFAGGDVEGGKQRRGAVATVIVCAALGRAERHGQDRRTAVQRLNLTFLVDTQHERPIRRREIEPHDVPHLVDEEGIARQFEGLGAMRLQPEGSPNAADRGMTQLELLGQRARTPMRRVPWCLLQCLGNHLLHLRIGKSARSPRTRLVDEPVQTLLDKAATPAPDRLPRDPQRARDLRIRAARGAAQHDLRTLGQALRRRPSSRPLLQSRSLARTHGHANCRASSFRHPRLLVPEVREARRIRFRTSDPGH